MADDAAEMCELFPEVERARVASITVWRVMLDDKSAEHLFALPYRWPADTTPELIGECAGGGMFRAQPRGRNGAYLKGVKPTEFALDGEARAFVPPGAMPPVAGAPEAPTVPLDSASHVGGDSTAITPAAHPTGAIAVPTAQPLPGMPSATLDLHALPPDARALVGVMHQLNAYTWSSIASRSTAETDARERVAGIAIKSMEELARVSSSAVQATATMLQHEVEVLQKLLDAERGRRAELETETQTLRATREADRIELAVLRTRMGLGPSATPAAAPSRGVLDVLQAVLVEAVHTMGVPVVAAALGVSPERLEQIASSTRPS